MIEYIILCVLILVVLAGSIAGYIYITKAFDTQHDLSKDLHSLHKNQIAIQKEIATSDVSTKHVMEDATTSMQSNLGTAVKTADSAIQQAKDTRAAFADYEKTTKGQMSQLTTQFDRMKRTFSNLEESARQLKETNVLNNKTTANVAAMNDLFGALSGQFTVFDDQFKGLSAAFVDINNAERDLGTRISKMIDQQTASNMSNLQTTASNLLTSNQANLSTSINAYTQQFNTFIDGFDNRVKTVVQPEYKLMGDKVQTVQNAMSNMAYTSNALTNIQGHFGKYSGYDERLNAASTSLYSVQSNIVTIDSNLKSAESTLARLNSNLNLLTTVSQSNSTLGTQLTKVQNDIKIVSDVNTAQFSGRLGQVETALQALQVQLQTASNVSASNQRTLSQLAGQQFSVPWSLEGTKARVRGINSLCIDDVCITKQDVTNGYIAFGASG